MNPKTNMHDSSLFYPAKDSIVFWEELAILGFTESVLKRMDAEGVSQTDLAKKMGVSDAYVTKLMRGNNNFTIRTMVKIAMALNCELASPQLKDHLAKKYFDSCKWNEEPEQVLIVHNTPPVNVRTEKIACGAADYEDLALAA
jgi:transcriptional regulator with XRE-family HTH domain